MGGAIGTLVTAPAQLTAEVEAKKGNDALRVRMGTTMNQITGKIAEIDTTISQDPTGRARELLDPVKKRYQAVRAKIAAGQAELRNTPAANRQIDLLAKHTSLEVENIAETDAINIEYALALDALQLALGLAGEFDKIKDRFDSLDGQFEPLIDDIALVTDSVTILQNDFGYFVEDFEDFKESTAFEFQKVADKISTVETNIRSDIAGIESTVEQRFTDMSELFLAEIGGVERRIGMEFRKIDDKFIKVENFFTKVKDDFERDANAEFVRDSAFATLLLM
jgi:predicted  nucleic acid-binding Zn-ribbon protein